jgi:hypothetical protein
MFRNFLTFVFYKQLRGTTRKQIAECHATCRLFILPGEADLDIVEDSYEPPTKKSKLFMSSLMDNPKQNASKGIDKVDRYLTFVLDDGEQYEDPLVFWRKHHIQTAFPNLTRLAMRYLSVPCSSAAVERQFSAAGQVITQRRANLDPTTVNDILFLRSVEKKLT